MALTSQCRGTLAARSSDTIPVIQFNALFDVSVRGRDAGIKPGGMESGDELLQSAFPLHGLEGPASRPSTVTHHASILFVPACCFRERSVKKKAKSS